MDWGVFTTAFSGGLGLGLAVILCIYLGSLLDRVEKKIGDWQEALQAFREAREARRRGEG